MTAPTAEALDFVATLAVQGSAPKRVGDRVIVTNGTEVIADETVESSKPNPDRARGTVATTHPDALVEYAITHRDASSRLYVVPDKMRLAVILNDHSASTPGWRDHVATMDLTPTPAWVRWTGANRKLMAQVDFAELIEEGLADVIHPDGADLLELAQSFHATSSAAFRGGQRLKDGAVSFTYTEDVSAVGGAQGTIAIPDRIALRIAPFYGAAQRDVVARFRYRLNGGKLALGYIIDGLDDLLREVMGEVAANVGDALVLAPICVSAIPAPVTPRH